MKLEVVDRAEADEAGRVCCGTEAEGVVGNANGAAAETWKNKIKRAIGGRAGLAAVAGAERFLPPQTFRTLAGIVGYEETGRRRSRLGLSSRPPSRAKCSSESCSGSSLRPTCERYKYTLRSFGRFSEETERRRARRDRPASRRALQSLATRADSGEEILPRRTWD